MRARTRTIVAVGVAALLGIVGYLVTRPAVEHPSTPSSARPNPAPTTRPGDRLTPETSPRLSRVPIASAPVDEAGQALAPGVLRQTYVRVDLPLAALAHPDAAGRSLAGFSVPVFDGHDIDIEITTHNATDEESGSFVGHVAGKPGSFVILGYDGEAEAGTIQIPEENYVLSISYAGDGILRIAEMDPKFVPGCGDPVVPGTDG